MSKFKDVYRWNVIDFLKGNTPVWVCDKAEKKVLLANAMNAELLIKIATGEDAENRYAFYVEVEE